MMTRSIVGRFLMVAVLLVSLGVIAQAALIISRQPGKTVAKTAPAPAAAIIPALAASAAVPAAAPANAAAPVAAQAPAADAATVRVVYPGPLGDTTPLRKIADAVPATPPLATSPPPVVAAVQPSPAPVQPAPAPPAPVIAAAAPAKPAPVVTASAEADTQPTADPPAAKGGINLNSASVEALNRLGGGHIGQAIVKHRPYHSVEELVKKRIVRRSVYEQIKDQVAAD